jgi:CubicO group peptidase (beta-lactamase class C family)
METQKLLNQRLWPAANARYSGYSFAIGQVGGEPAASGFGGHKDAANGSGPITQNTRFDLASITKLYTATLAAVLHADSKIDLFAPLSSWSDLSQELGGLSSAELLTHTSGLPAEWQEQASRQETIEALLQLKPEPSQRGSLLYSCTGYSLFAICVEQLLGKRFDLVLSELVLEPLGLSQTGYLPNDQTLNIASSCGPNENIASGIVHDPRARAMDGVSGNAGLFASAKDVFRFFSEVVSGDKSIVTESARAVLFNPIAKGDWEQSIGFRYLDAERLGANKHFYSHSGFTGTLAMVDPETRQVAVMLTNRLVCETTREELAPIYVEFAESVQLQN